MTTTSSISNGPLRAVMDPIDEFDVEVLSEVARDATKAQNLASATRLEAAFRLVEAFRKSDETEEASRDRSTSRRSKSSTKSGKSSRPAYSRLDPADRARNQLSAAMNLSTWHAARLVNAGVEIHTKRRLLRDAIGHGLFPEQLAIDTACRLSEVPDRVARKVESEVVGRMSRVLDGGGRPSRVAMDAMVDASLAKHDPQAASDAADLAVYKRDVRFRPGKNGMTTLWANLPAGDAEKLRRRIDAAAKAAEDSGHPRTRPELRADALCALGDPTTDDICNPIDKATGTPWASDKAIRVSIIDGRPLGLPNQVEFVRGAYASFDWVCEQLIESGDAKFRFERIDPTPGSIDSPEAALKYFINGKLAERIRLRDGTCRHPGCNVDAQDCDIDHVLAFNTLQPELGGPTVEWNLVCLCREHHREKTFGSNAYRPGPLGELTIITESGHEYRTFPSGPLAKARDQILDHRWAEHVESLIADDLHLTNPPGADRRFRSKTPREPSRPSRSSGPAGTSSPPGPLAGDDSHTA